MTARQLSRYLTLAGQSELARSMVRAMRYDEMREHVRQHFADRLKDFQERTAATGPASGPELDTLKTCQELAESDSEVWGSVLADGTDGLIQAFCEACSIAPEPEGRERELMIAELQKGHREYLARALEHVAKFDALPLLHERTTKPPISETEVKTTTSGTEALPLGDVAERYMQELQVAQALAAKTASEKRDALALLAELVDNKPPAIITKSDARAVKDAVMKLPKNRSKNPVTRDLTLREALEFQGAERISVRTMNVYLGHMQSMFTWAVSNGYADDNVFSGMRVKRSTNAEDKGRKAFTNPVTNYKIGDFQPNEVTASQLAVDCKIEERQIPEAFPKFQPSANGPDLLGKKRAFLTDQAPFVPWCAFRF